MKLNELYRVESDDYNVIVSKKIISKTKAGEEKIIWKNIGFCRDINSALKYIAKKEILGTGLKDLEEVNNKIKELYEYIDKLIPSGK